MTDFTNPTNDELIYSFATKNGDTLTTKSGSKWVWQGGAWYPVAFNAGASISPVTAKVSPLDGRSAKGNGGIDLSAGDGKIISGIPFCWDLATPYSLYGTTSRIDLGSVTIPPAYCQPGAMIKGWATFSGSKDANTKTALVSVNEAGGGMYGATDICNVALGTTSFSGRRIEFWMRILNLDAIQGGQYGSTTGLGDTGSSVTTNPIIVPVNMRGGGLDVAFGGNVTAASTASVDVSSATPSVVTHTAHGKFVGQMVSFASAPTGMTSGRPYFIVSVIDANTYTVAETKGGSAVATTAAATGITATYYNVLTLEDAHIEVSL